MELQRWKPRRQRRVIFGLLIATALSVAPFATAEVTSAASQPKSTQHTKPIESWSGSVLGNNDPKPKSRSLERNTSFATFLPSFVRYWQPSGLKEQSRPMKAPSRTERGFTPTPVSRRSGSHVLARYILGGSSHPK